MMVLFAFNITHGPLRLLAAFRIQLIGVQPKVDPNSLSPHQVRINLI